MKPTVLQFDNRKQNQNKKWQRQEGENKDKESKRDLNIIYSSLPEGEEVNEQRHA
jgi:hypothetical protein